MAARELCLIAAALAPYGRETPGSGHLAAVDAGPAADRGCSVPVGAYAEARSDGLLSFHAQVTSLDGTRLEPQGGQDCR
jgi:hypothetical protein